MKAAVITFPGSNCDPRPAVALGRAAPDVDADLAQGRRLPAGTDLGGAGRIFLWRLSALRRHRRPFARARAVHDHAARAAMCWASATAFRS